VDICEQIASTKTIDLAIRYATRINKMALANKLEMIADAKSVFKNSEKEENTINHLENTASNDDVDINTQEEENISLPVIKNPEMEIKPLAMSQIKRVNPFLKAENSSLSPRGK